MNATLKETAGTRFLVVDEYGDTWRRVAVDNHGNMAVERDSGERWEARQFTVSGSFLDGSKGDLWSEQEEGSIFDAGDGTRWVARRVDSAGSIRWHKSRKSDCDR
jgi:hypothetical protein